MADNVKQNDNTRGTLKLHGLYSRVARSENVSRQFVHQVASGVRKSARISRALKRERNRLLKQLLKEAA